MKSQEEKDRNYNEETENRWPEAEIKRWGKRLRTKSWEGIGQNEELWELEWDWEWERKWLDKFINEQQLSEHKRDIEKWKTSKSFNCFASNTTKWIVNKTRKFPFISTNWVCIESEMSRKLVGIVKLKQNWKANNNFIQHRARAYCIRSNWSES